MKKPKSYYAPDMGYLELSEGSHILASSVPVKTASKEVKPLEEAPAFEVRFD